MSLAFVIDMNLSPDWAAVLEAASPAAEHWSAIGPSSAPDDEIMS